MKKSIICQWDADVDGWELGRKGIVRSDNRLRGKHRHCLLILITGVVSPQGFLITGRRRSHRRRVPLGRRWSPTDQPLLLQRVIVGCGGFWAKGTKVLNYLLIKRECHTNWWNGWSQLPSRARPHQSSAWQPSRRSPSGRCYSLAGCG